MEEKKVVTLDVTGCKSRGELHRRIREAFEFPDFYGQNWDAFWDLLRSECDADKVVVIGAYTLPRELGPSAEMIKSVLQEFKENCMRDGEAVEIAFRG